MSLFHCNHLLLPPPPWTNPKRLLKLKQTTLVSLPIHRHPKKPTNDQQNQAKSDPCQSNNITEIGTKQNLATSDSHQSNNIIEISTKQNPTKLYAHQSNNITKIGTIKIGTKFEPPKSNQNQIHATAPPSQDPPNHPLEKCNNLATPCWSRNPETSTSTATLFANLETRNLHAIAIPMLPLDPRRTHDPCQINTTTMRERLEMSWERKR